MKNYIYKPDTRGSCGFHCIKIKEFGVKIGGDTILSHINMHIHCGQMTSIIGKNGAGKTTLMKAILDEVKHEGSIEFKNVSKLEGHGKEEIGTKMSGLKIGYVPQGINFAKNTPVSVYDLFAGFITKVPVFWKKSQRAYEEIKAQLERFDSSELIDKAVCDLSGGELQRVLLSIATQGEPNLLILDEPVSGIDRNGMELFYKNIDYLKKNCDLAIIMVSHDLEYVKKYSDYVVLLDKTILAEGTPKELFRSSEFNRVFG